MRIVFGMSADGRTYPEYPGSGRGILGGCVVGPTGLLNLLAMQLGLVRPPVSSVVRIATWQRKMEAAGENRFWSDSMAADPWSTARLVLSWRDALKEAGWFPTLLPGVTGRLRDIADAETRGPALPAGRGDLLWEVIARIEAGDPIDVETISIIDRALPPGWQRLVEALQARQVAVEQHPDTPSAAGATDLGRAQRFLAAGTAQPIQGDSSLVEICAGTSVMAAEIVAEWIAHHSGSKDIDTVIIAPDGDTTLIDLALAKRGLPRLGLSPGSPHRGTLQLLPLAFAMAWKPFNPQRVMELLLLPRSPIPKSISWRFTRALAARPGRSAVRDPEIWAAVEAALGEQDPTPAPAEIKAQLDRWRAWLDSGNLDPADGITVVDAFAICKRVRDWALAAARDGDALLASVIGAADMLMESLLALDKPSVSRLQLERMIEQAINDGLSNPELFAEAGPIRALDCPGGLWGPIENVIWWNFAGKPPTASWPWSAAEYAALEAAKCAPERPAAAARRQEDDWTRAVLNAAGRLLLVRPVVHNGADTVSHPLAHRLAPLLHPPGGPHATRIDAEALLAAPELNCADRVLARDEAERIKLAAQRAVWAIDAAVAERVPERSESATSLKDLMGCQLKWLLQHVARLRPGSLAEVPNASRLFGNLAHAMAQAVFQPGAVPDPDGMLARAQERFDQLVEDIAAPLLQPALASELAYARAHLPEALAALARLLADRNLAVDAMEQAFARELDGIRLHGRLDMLARSHAGPAIIDLKWSGEKTRRNQLANGEAIQLATYSRLVAKTGGVPAGYFIIKTKTLLTESNGALPGEQVTPDRSLDDTWNAVVSDWQLWLERLRSGTVIASGLPDAAAAMPAGLGFAPGNKACTFCDYRGLCRVDEEA